MPEEYVGRLTPDMDVCDIDGHRLGKVARVHRDELSGLPPARNAETAHDEPRRPDVMEVKSGLFGLGGRLYIPVSAIQDATEQCVFVVKQTADRADEWRRKPDYLDQLR